MACSVGGLVWDRDFTLAITGLTWSSVTGTYIKQGRAAVGWESPRLNTTTTSDIAPVDISGDTIDKLAQVGENSGLELPISISDTARGPGPAALWKVSESWQGWRFTADQIAVDPTTGSVENRLNFADAPLVSKLTSWGILLHFGILLGGFNEALLVLTGIAIAAIIVLGYRMWWQRRLRTVNTLSVGKAPRRGAWRHASPLQLVLAALVMAPIAWYIPTVGVTMLIFVAVDALIGLKSRAMA